MLRNRLEKWIRPVAEFLCDLRIFRGLSKPNRVLVRHACTIWSEIANILKVNWDALATCSVSQYGWAASAWNGYHIDRRSRSIRPHKMFLWYILSPHIDDREAEVQDSWTAWAAEHTVSLSVFLVMIVPRDCITRAIPRNTAAPLEVRPPITDP